MSTYFAFSDECGDYKPKMGKRKLQSHPYYIRTTLIIGSTEWKELDREFKELKKKYKIPYSLELKWANLWTLRKYQNDNKTIPENHDAKPFESYDYHDIIDFVEESLFLINNLNFKKVIVSYTKNRKSRTINEMSLLQMHLQEHMQRIEMEMDSDENNLCVLFFDPVDAKKNEYFRRVYNDLYRNGDFIDEYNHIKDSLNFENSHHSVGIQIADYISGAFSALLKSYDRGNYDRGIQMFFDSVYPNLRRSPQGIIQGYGIREVTSSLSTRKWLTDYLEKLITERKREEQPDDLPF